MNINTPYMQQPTTMAAEGLPRRRFTVAEIEKICGKSASGAQR